MFARNSGLMPIPVSDTVYVSCTQPGLALASSRMSTLTRPPGSVYLMALERMLMQIWFRRS